jgi:hypothetical protein
MTYYIDQRQNIKQLNDEYQRLTIGLTAQDWNSMRTPDYWTTRDRLCHDLVGLDCHEARLRHIIEHLKEYKNQL